MVEFCGFLPLDAGCEIINSEDDPLTLPCREYLMVTADSDTILYYEIRGECSGAFKQADLAGNILAIGVFDKFYLFDIVKSNLISVHQCEWYFGSFEKDCDFFYVCDANGITCIRKDGKIIWENKNLGIDGVIISSIDKVIEGKGEWDPPEGWRDFKVDAQTGLKI